ncbi:MAG: hypothetical protein ACJ77K_16200 [Bacteroidia bacterium]
MKTIAHLFLCTIILLSSCSNDHGKTADPAKETKDTLPVQEKEKFETGKVIDKIIDLNDPSQTYAIYLPSNYKTDKPLPVIYFFDAHATGKLPVSKYKEIAETNGYILIGSNNSKNGTSWEETQTIAAKLFSDSQQRIAINTDRIWLCGFSGGARVANALCVANGGIAGVICCGAAAPAAISKDPRSNYTFLGICGTRDFNYIEMRKYDMVDLAGHGVKHAFVEFDGKHEWPDIETMKEGFLWAQLCSVRNGKAKLSEGDHGDSLIALSEKMIGKAFELKGKGNAYEAYNQLKKSINFFDGIDIINVQPSTKIIGPELFKKYEELKKDPAVDKKLKSEEVTWKKEQELQSYYQSAFQDKNIDWWRQDIVSLNKKVKSADKEEALMYARTLDYLSLLAYMQTTGAMQQQNLPAAKMFSGIYLLVDPTNSEAHYLAAELAAIEKNKDLVMSELKKAADNGFKEADRMQSDQFFGSLTTTDEFKTILKKVNENTERDL